jgi:predicted peroxiredoxin
MKKIIAVIAAAIFVLMVAVGVSNDGAAESPRDGVFVHISHGTDDPHRLLMALSMADMMTEDHDVLVYFDITGVDAVLKDPPDITFAHFPSSQSALASLRAKNVVLMVCPGCLKAAGKSKEDLAEGIQIADKATFFSFTKGRILTLDY